MKTQWNCSSFFVILLPKCLPFFPCVGSPCDSNTNICIKHVNFPIYFKFRMYSMPLDIVQYWFFKIWVVVEIITVLEPTRVPRVREPCLTGMFSWIFLNNADIPISTVHVLYLVEYVQFFPHRYRQKHGLQFKFALVILFLFCNFIRNWHWNVVYIFKGTKIKWDASENYTDYEDLREY
jgi:hypothetical protein